MQKIVYNMPMKKIYVSKHADRALIEYLAEKDYEVVLVEAMADVDEAIACHPDIYMCDLGNVVYHGDSSKLTHDYPGHAKYNACSTGKYFIHNLKITDKGLLGAAKAAGLIAVHVPQGYAKCSIVAVDENSIITADKGIERACTAAGLDVLLVEKGQIVLEGYPYGFIGGASGKISTAGANSKLGSFSSKEDVSCKQLAKSKDTIVFNGDIRKHSDYETIKAFIEARGLGIKYFEGYPLTDIGSIIPEYSSGFSDGFSGGFSDCFGENLKSDASKYTNVLKVCTSDNREEV